MIAWQPAPQQASQTSDVILQRANGFVPRRAAPELLLNPSPDRGRGECRYSGDPLARRDTRSATTHKACGFDLAPG
jgi:hypothetical protein